MKTFQRYIVLFIVFFAGNAVNAFSQDSLFSKHELGIDVANALTFIKRNTQSYLLNYRYNFAKRTSMRAGLNLDIGNGGAEGIYPDVKIGIQRNNRDGKHWNLYYGADLTFSYYKSNAVETRITRWGASPLLGVQYYIHRKISLSTEASLNFNLYKQRTPGSFDPAANTSFYRIFIGSVGMMLISYHFN